MSVSKKTKFADHEQVQAFIIHIGAYDFAFTNPEQAVHALHSLQHAVEVDHSYDSGVDYQPTSRQKDVRLTSAKVKLPDVQGSPYYQVTCDQVQVDNINLCGASPCYNTVKVDELDELRLKGWRHMKIDGKDVCTCPKCLKRIAEIDGVEPAELHDFALWEAWSDSQEAMKRKKDE